MVSYLPHRNCAAKEHLGQAPRFGWSKARSNMIRMKQAQYTVVSFFLFCSQRGDHEHICKFHVGVLEEMTGTFAPNLLGESCQSLFGGPREEKCSDPTVTTKQDPKRLACRCIALVVSLTLLCSCFHPKFNQDSPPNLLQSSLLSTQNLSCVDRVCPRKRKNDPQIQNYLQASGAAQPHC